MIQRRVPSIAPTVVCLTLVAAMGISGCSENDNNIAANETDEVTDSVTGIEDGDAISPTTDAVVGSTTSTAGVVCDYMYSEYNASPSVDTMSESAWTCTETDRELTANGIPDHDVGTFPNAGNPNTISEQEVSASYTLTPVETDTATTLGGPRGAVGYVLNGIKMDPATGGSCDDSGDTCSAADPTLGWNLEALGQTSFDFGEDMNNAHVQPGGEYHYHGLPEGFIDGIDVQTGMTLIGWAADGFPIYARYGYEEPLDASSSLKVMEGSYQLVSTVSTSRPSTELYSLGTFQQDWQYVGGSGDLDECNGRTGVTPEFPGGIYHYFATDSYPYMQRCVKGSVDVNQMTGPAQGPGAPESQGMPEVFGSPPSDGTLPQGTGTILL